MVQKKGFEPSQCRHHRILSPARLPVPPLLHKIHNSIHLFLAIVKLKFRKNFPHRSNSVLGKESKDGPGKRRKRNTRAGPRPPSYHYKNKSVDRPTFPKNPRNKSRPGLPVGGKSFYRDGPRQIRGWPSSLLGRSLPENNTKPTPKPPGSKFLNTYSSLPCR